MSWKNVSLIFQREVRDQLRDRRTIFMVAVLPLLLYPALGLGMFQMITLFSEQPRTVVILGEEHLPEPPQLLQDNKFVSNYFLIPANAEKLIVVTDKPATESETEAQTENEAEQIELIDRAREIRVKVEERQQLQTQKDEAEHAVVRIERTLSPMERRKETGVKSEEHGQLQAEQEKANEELAQIDKQLRVINRDLSKALAKSKIQVLIIIPDGFAENVDEVNKKLAEHTLDSAEQVDYARPTMVYNQADEKSSIAYRRVKEAMDSWEEIILQQRLKEANLPPTLFKAVNPDAVNLAEQDQIAANMWSKLFPALLVIMTVTGAFYPAVDLAAGEKERGTMETLLICPATRSEIVLGKFLTVMLFSASTALLNLASMGVTGGYMASMAGSLAAKQMGDIPFPSGSALLWLMVLLIPLAALFSALCLALATFARSTKEGQYYLTPLLMVTMGLTVFCVLPGVEITPFRSIMPVIGVALLLKALLLSTAHEGSLYLYMIPVLVTSIGYSLLALWWAIELFKREDVLFRESERFDLRLWVQHVLRDKEATPSFTEAGFCFVTIMMLTFASMKFMGQAVSAGLEKNPTADLGGLMMKLLIIQQLVIIATPALIMGIMLTTSAVRTFRIRMPRISMLGIAAVLPLALHVLSLELQISLAWFFPSMENTGIQQALATMNNAAQPVWFVLLAFAVAPAFCEEIAFRGFILSGFRHSKRVGLAILLSALTFGIMHMIPQQVFNATLLGLVLGLIAIRSGSLVPCILFHFIYNSLGVLHGRYSATFDGKLPDSIQNGPLSLFLQLDAGTLHYRWPALVIAAVIAIVGLRWLVKQNDAQTRTTPDELAETFSEPILDETSVGKQQVSVGS